jgi:hypothetical protein
MANLYLRKVQHSQAPNNFRVIILGRFSKCWANIAAIDEDSPIL